MCGSSDPPATQQVNTTTTNVPEYLQYPIINNAARAEAVANRPYQAYGGQRVAGMDAGYGQATGIVNGLQTNGPLSYSGSNPTGGSDYVPTNFQQGSGYGQTSYTSAGFDGGQQYQQGSYSAPTYGGTQFQQGADYAGANLESRPDYSYNPYQGGTYGTGANYSGLGSYSNTPGAASYSPQEASLREYSQADVDRYMSPYLNNVVDAQVSRANTQFDRDMAVTRLQSARGGGYGDYGSRVTEAVLRSDHNRNVNDMVASSLQSGYRDATGLMQSWRDADLSRQGLSQADRQFGGQLNQSDRQFGRTSDLNDAQFASDLDFRKAQEMNNRTMSDAQFGANINSENSQFGARMGLDQAQELNRLREQQAQYGYTAGQNERQQLNQLRMQDAQYGAGFAADQAQFGANFGASERQFGTNTANDIANRRNDFNLNQNQFDANFRAGENQFGATLAQNERMALNELTAKERQYGHTMSQEERQQLNDLRMRDAQFGANYNMDAQNQRYNQQMGIAAATRDDADRNMRYEQAGLDTNYQNFMDSRDWDQNQIKFLTSVLYGAPGSVQNDYSNVYRNPLAQGIGSAAAIAALANGAGG